MSSEKNCCFRIRFSRIIALTIGWMGVVLSGVLIYALCEYPARFGKNIHETIFPFLPALNLVASYSWIFGVDRNKPEFMLAASVWWGLNLCLVFVGIFTHMFMVHQDQQRSPHQDMYFCVATVYWVCSYVIAIFCYKSINRADKNPGTPV